MIIKSLKMDHFRNYDSLNIDFMDGTTILYGDNAQGKTNILEAIYVAATSKSHKGSKDKEMIQFNQDEAHINIQIEKKGSDYVVDMHLKKNKLKGIAINKIPIKKASELFGILNVILFSPEDLNIIKNGPSERRRFLDLELCQLDKIYLNDLVSYNKILNQRNKLLKDILFKPDLESTLEIWNDQLIDYGTKIIRKRAEFIQQLNSIIFGIHKKLSGNKEDLMIQYEPNVNEKYFREELLKQQEKDKKSLSTSVGPHRDDFCIFIKNVDIRKYGSQGQQRSAALSLKLSEIEFVKSMIHDNPVLLLDDVLSELDSLRQHQLLESIHDVQTVISCTGLDEFIKNRFKINRVYQVIDGKIEQFKDQN
ncbi:MAG: DNA replication/repair protein RecF [Lachnospiraceae bacterium]|jgi:DNA replication and repair protein RecF|nr:DNA replication/repair protein RecF [Lachnospiraceae bacterium]